MKKVIISCLAIMALCSIFSFSQVKYDSNGQFGVGISAPYYFMHLYDQDPVMVLQSDIDHDSYFRLIEGGWSYRGGFLNYDGGDNMMYIGMHKTGNRTLSDDKRILGIDRDYGYIDYWPLKTTAYSTTFRTYCLGDDVKNYIVVRGIGGPHTFYVYGDGDAVCKSMTQTSDSRLKTDIKPIGSSHLLKLRSLNGIDYLMKRIASVDSITKDIQFEAEPYPERSFGFAAQEVEELFPDLVMEDENGIKSVNYIGLIPIMIEALKEQQDQITNLQDQIKSLSGISPKSASIPTFIDPDITEFPTLSQNIPNPFNETTTIKYSAPTIESYATVNIYDLQGAQVKNFKISQIGPGEVEIPASELSPGIYIYNLIVDAQVIDTKQMILTE